MSGSEFLDQFTIKCKCERFECLWPSNISGGKGRSACKLRSKCSCSKHCMCGVAPVLYWFSSRLVTVASITSTVVGTVWSYGNDSIAGMNRRYGNESNRSIAGINDSFAIARINFFLRASTTVCSSTGVTKKDTFWRLCTLHLHHCDGRTYDYDQDIRHTIMKQKDQYGLRGGFAKLSVLWTSLPWIYQLLSL